MTVPKADSPVRRSRRAKFLVLFTGVALVVLLSPGATAHGAGGELFEGAEKVIMPFAKTPPIVDGLIGAGEYSDSGTWEEGGLQLLLAHNDSAIFVGLRPPGSGWVGVALSSDVDAGANVVVATMYGTAARISDNFAANVTDEMVNVPDTAVGGTSDILAFATTSSPAGATYEFATPIVSQDPHDQQFEAGVLYPFAVAFNETAQGFPASLAEGTMHLLRVYVARAQDDLAAIRDLFMANPTAIPALTAMAVFSVGAGALFFRYLAPRREGVR